MKIIDSNQSKNQIELDWTEKLTLADKQIELDSNFLKIDQLIKPQISNPYRLCRNPVSFVPIGFFSNLPKAIIDLAIVIKLRFNYLQISQIICQRQFSWLSWINFNHKMIVPIIFLFNILVLVSQWNQTCKCNKINKLWKSTWISRRTTWQFLSILPSHYDSQWF